MYDEALKFATERHSDQKRWDGSPYINHPRRVAEKFSDDLRKTVAVLHDVVEDTDITLEDLEKLGIPGSVVGAVKAITKRKDENYLDYILRVSRNPLATKVKIEDLNDNMKGATNQRREKYELAQHILKESQDGSTSKEN